MKALLLLLVAVVSVFGMDHWHMNLRVQHLPKPSLPKRWFDQKQDHFDLSNTKTWKQLYYINDMYFRPGGPIFYYFNGEAELMPQVLTELSFVSLAKEMGGMIISQEHRYYGESYPVPSLATENMKYLSSQQALADAAYMQQNITRTYPGASSSKWLAVGGSYSGALVAWYRIKYPGLVVGAYSSSGVVHAEANYFGYWEVIEYALKHADKKTCQQDAAAEIAMMVKMLNTTAGQQKLAQDFLLCKNQSSLVSQDAKDNFLWTFATCSAADQYGGPDKFCGTLEGGASKWSGYVKACIGTPKKGACELDNTWMAYNTTKLDSLLGGRSWFWQKCTQFGWFKSSPANSMWPKEITYPWLVSHCASAFGLPGMMPDTDFTNLYYGGYSAPGTNILFVAGTFDPWNKVQVTTPFPDAVATNRPNIFINGTAHCADLDPPKPTDSIYLKDARMKIRAWVMDLLDFA
eukprot:TRINITY_DN65739_c7_g2_i1.p2 TRINITY_DN65739_c7_g2~~TRINITY_DN65739_c7_g2_i1.p2  ORF type:complete len:473 (+),score=101.31 TRINITY_DN65739_c7_g2_i1:36-1421(+)